MCSTNPGHRDVSDELGLELGEGISGGAATCSTNRGAGGQEASRY